MGNFYVVGDIKLDYRDAFVCPEDELEDKLSNYSGYYVVREYASKADAEAFCKSYNSYEGESDEILTCCSSGCRMSAYEYAQWNGKCAYMG